MNLRAVDLNLFPVFEAIYAERSLTRAGETLNMTQPAVSNALARLRAAFGDPLFARSGKGMAPTAAAEALIGPVRESLARLSAGLDERGQFDAATSERIFNVAIRDTAASAVLPALANRIETAAPNVRFQFHAVDRTESPHELAARRLDFVIDTPDLARSELGSELLHRDRFVVVMRKGHPAEKGRLTLKRFLELRHVTASSRRVGRTIVDLALQRIGERIKPVMRLAHYQPGFPIVAGSDLVLLAPMALAQLYDLVWKELPFEAPTLDLYLYWRRNLSEEPAMRWAREQLLASAGKSAERKVLAQRA